MDGGVRGLEAMPDMTLRTKDGIKLAAEDLEVDIPLHEIQLIVYRLQRFGPT
jgi:hypothetical protein